MNTTGIITLIIFMIGWLGCATSWFYSLYHLIMSRLRSRDFDSRSYHTRKAFKGMALFVGFWLLGVVCGLIGGEFGAWQEPRAQHRSIDPSHISS